MAQDHQEYVQTKVNPVLESLVTQVLLERPDDPVSFMVKWLSEHAKSNGASSVRKSETSKIGELKKTMADLQNTVRELEMKVDYRASGYASVKEKPGGATQAPSEDDSDSESDEDSDSMPLPPKDFTKEGHRASVSAEAYGSWNQKKEFVPTVIPKSDEQKERIKEILCKCFLFAALNESELGTVVDVMMERRVEPKVRVINEGDDGDVLYVIEKGTLDCYKANGSPDPEAKQEEILVKTCVAGDAFGELALLYNCPRAASVESRDECVLWQLGREAFNAIVREAAGKKREMYEAFLRSVEILHSLDNYEILQIADALQSEEFNAGDYVVKQGDPGHKFFIIEEGKGVATKSIDGKEPVETMQYKRGDYFGELALLRNAPRTANIIATTKLKVLSLTRRTFTNQLGPLQSILERNTDRYN
eukprot:GEMP01045534.1.p1 GENE.GEMP01045534.1~~GEMP01045534.1.p1  ORF type:complete len:420 (+),score=96.47 GEMP01045534.1:245-1504(+)